MVPPMASSCDMLPPDADQLHPRGALRPFCEKFGIWGGMSERERRRIRRQRALARAAAAQAGNVTA